MQAVVPQTAGVSKWDTNMNISEWLSIQFDDGYVNGPSIHMTLSVTNWITFFPCFLDDISLMCYTSDLWNIICQWNGSRYGGENEYKLFYKMALRCII